MPKILVTLMAIAAAGTAGAQIALPQVQLPKLPEVQLPVDVGKTVSGVTGAVDPQQLVQLRPLRIRELLRTHRDLIEADPHGEPIVRAELLAFSPSSAALEQVRAAGFSVTRERALEGLEVKILVLRAPAGMSTRRALKRLKTLDPDGTYDFNHIYMDSGFVGSNAPTPAAGHVLLAKADIQKEPANTADTGVKIGLIDAGVDAVHPVFHDLAIHQYGCSNKPVASAHGTAVASLMIGRSDKFHGSAPGAELYAADVYCGLPTGGAVDAVADAFGWLSRERVAVVNVSLVGPPNALLGNVIRLMIARGYIIVAAVGNDGPNSPPLYPAAYADVVGVTAVDTYRRVLLEAVRGRQVDFAAFGIGLAAAGGNGFAAVRGTSFAAPIVAGLLAPAMHGPNKAAGDSAIAHLAAQAIDLGPRGMDTTYGRGLVGENP